MNSGIHGEYGWVEISEASLHFVDLVLGSHRGSHLYITSFDSGPITPSKDEKAQGWYSQGEVMVSPRLDEGTTVPYDNFDEWYFFEKSVSFPPDHEIFVNYGGFSLVPVEKHLKNFDPSWEQDALEWLRPLQERFWEQLSRLDPTTFVAMGDRDIVVSKNESLLGRLREGA